MKNLKIVFVLVAICATLFTSCEKDDDNTSSPGYFIVDGKKYELTVAYYETGYESDDAIHHRAYFFSDGMPTDTEQILQSNTPVKGAMAYFDFIDPIMVKIPVQGEYTQQPDHLTPKSFTYYNFWFAYSTDWRKGEDTTITKIFAIDEILEVKKEDDVYEFKSAGNTIGEKKPFEFYYKGTLAPNPEN
jgi:hypothetical protein